MYLVSWSRESLEESHVRRAIMYVMGIVEVFQECGEREKKKKKSW